MTSGNNGQITPYQADVSNQEEVKAVIAAILER